MRYCHNFSFTSHSQCEGLRKKKGREVTSIGNVCFFPVQRIILVKLQLSYEWLSSHSWITKQFHTWIYIYKVLKSLNDNSFIWCDMALQLSGTIHSTAEVLFNGLQAVDLISFATEASLSLVPFSKMNRQNQMLSLQIIDIISRENKDKHNV